MINARVASLGTLFLFLGARPPCLPPASTIPRVELRRGERRHPPRRQNPQACEAFWLLPSALCAVPSNVGIHRQQWRVAVLGSVPGEAATATIPVKLPIPRKIHLKITIPVMCRIIRQSFLVPWILHSEIQKKSEIFTGAVGGQPLNLLLRSTGTPAMPERLRCSTQRTTARSFFHCAPKSPQNFTAGSRDAEVLRP